MDPLILFGPQRLEPVLKPELERLAVGEPVASITAGWQEREGELEDLGAHLGRRVVDLELHRRCDEVFARDDELFAAHRARQDRLQALQRLYRYRLDFVLEPARDLMRRGGDPELLDPERESAIEAVRQLDRQHLERVTEVHRQFNERWRPQERPAVQEHRRQIEDLLADCQALAIAGGHVAVLLNRMRLFGVGDLLARQPVLAWSAGAMALAERVVLFHDSPPQGAGNPEVLDVGLGICRGVVPLPDARRRLRLHDPVRVSLFARRFSPDLCLPLEQRMSVRWTADGPRNGTGSLRLLEDGRVVPLEGEDT